MALYALGCIALFAVASPVGSNVARLAPLVAGPLAALLWWPRRKWALIAVALPLLYLQWQAPVRDIRTADDNREVTSRLLPAAHLLSEPAARPAVPDRDPVHAVPLGGVRGGALVPARTRLGAPARHQGQRAVLRRQADGRHGTDAWLHRLAVRLRRGARRGARLLGEAEVALIDRGLPYLHLVLEPRHWRVYAVRDATPIVQGAAILTRSGPTGCQLQASGPGQALIRVRWSPYWAVTQGSGCVADAGGFTTLHASAAPDRCVWRSASRSTRIGATLAAVQLTETEHRASLGSPDGVPPTPPIRLACPLRPAESSAPPIHRGAGLAAWLAGPDPSDRCCSSARCSLYDLVRGLVSTRQPVQAVRRRDADHRLERTLHVFIEPSVQAWAINKHWLMDAPRLDLPERPLRRHVRWCSRSSTRGATTRSTSCATCS